MHTEVYARHTSAACPSHSSKHCTGRTNSFHVASGSELASRYNDINVLENHHCAMTFSMLEGKDGGLLQHLDRSIQQAGPKTQQALLPAQSAQNLRIDDCFAC